MSVAAPGASKAAAERMKSLLQRVSRATVTVKSETVGEIAHGLLVFLGLDRDDDRAGADRMLDKLLAYRSSPIAKVA